MKQDVFKLNGKFCIYIDPPHLSEGQDWHNAYIDIIRKIVSASGTQDRPIGLPKYPLYGALVQDELLFEVGSYWEGAMYFLCVVLEARTPYQGLRLLEDDAQNSSLSPNQELFLKVWNSHGQLKWLKAFLIRKEFSRSLLSSCGAQKRDVPEILRLAKLHSVPELIWLALFVDQHHEEGEKYPNPYFGGDNALHLGLVEGCVCDF